MPTSDLYFLNIVTRARNAADNTVAVLEPNVYAVGKTAVVSRFSSDRLLRRIGTLGIDRIVYIADDDFAAGAADENLPPRYRQKLRNFVSSGWREIVEAADAIIVPSEPLAEQYGAKSVMMHPVWDAPPAPTRHFDDPARIEMAYLGTGSHAQDLHGLAGVLTGILDENERLRLTVLLGELTPASLARHPRVSVLRPMRWWRYKRWLERRRFHLCIYPLQDTPFNSARSANKLLEHAVAGAASLVSPIPAMRDFVGDSIADVFVEGDAAAWGERIRTDLADLLACRRRAEEMRAGILAANLRGAAARHWQRMLR